MHRMFALHSFTLHLRQRQNSNLYHNNDTPNHHLAVLSRRSHVESGIRHTATLFLLHTQGQPTDHVCEGVAGQHPQNARQVGVGQHTKQVAEGLEGHGQAATGQARQVEQARGSAPVVAAVHEVGEAVHECLHGVLRKVDQVVEGSKGATHTTTPAAKCGAGGEVGQASTGEQASAGQGGGNAGDVACIANGRGGGVEAQAAELVGG